MNTNEKKVRDAKKLVDQNGVHKSTFRRRHRRRRFDNRSLIVDFQLITLMQRRPSQITTLKYQHLSIHVDVVVTLKQRRLIKTFK
jgi:hypothetical protein